MSRRYALLSVVAFCLLGSPHRAFSKAGRGDRKKMKTQVAAVVDGDNRFAFDLYERLKGGEGNRFFSPASISLALAMAYTGAAGNTEAEMAKTLHFQIPKEELEAQMRALLATLTTQDKKQGFRLDIANRLWGQEGYQFLSEFLQVTRTDYGAELGRLDFRTQTEQARQTINAWVEEHTARKITNLIPSASTLTGARLVLTNAVYFKGDWQSPFDKSQTKDEDFHVTAGRAVKAPFMHKKAHFGYAAVEGLQLLKLPYGDGSLSMIVMLPDKVDGLADLEAKLNYENFEKWSALVHSQEVIVQFPRFKSTSSFELSDVLKAMGMASAFNPPAADFSGMAGNRELFISAVLHKAYVDVNEEGTEAAAATGVVVRAMAVRLPKPIPVFRADHPYVFMIRDERTGAILFLGRVVDPS